MKKYLLLLLFAPLFLKAQNKQLLNLTTNYYPSPVLDWSKQFYEISFYAGSENFKLGASIQTDGRAKNIIFGIESQTKLLKLSDGIELSAITGIGINGAQTHEVKFSAPHHQHYIEAGIELKYPLTPTISIKQSIKKQYSENEGKIVFSGGIVIKVN